MGDVPLLAYYFVGRFAAQLGKQLDGIQPATMERLVSYAWPGNIRELENVIERAVILCRGEMLDIDPMMLQAGQCTPISPRREPPSADVRVFTSTADAGPNTLEDVERNHIRAVLEKTNWRIEGDHGAARILDLHPNTLRSRMKKLGIVRPD